MSTKLSLNQKYLKYLAQYPLLTKSLTAGVLAVLNELIASIISKDLRITTILDKKVKHPLTWKLPIFAIFAALFSAPLSHYGLRLVNTVIKPPLTFKKKILQILLSLTTFAPLLNVLFVSFVSVVNLDPHLQSLSTNELKRALASTKLSLKKSLFSVVKSSWVTTPFVLTVCQRYLEPEHWAVFSNLVYFILGTGQNTLLKIRNKEVQKNEKKRAEIDAEVERELESDGQSATDLSVIEKPVEEAETNNAKQEPLATTGNQQTVIQQSESIESQ